MFTFDANLGATRTGTLTIAGATLTITQAGSSYVAASPVSAVLSTGLNEPYGVAVDGSGNVYIADTFHNKLEEWSPSAPLAITTLASGLNAPASVAVDGAGNVYIAENGSSEIDEWSPAAPSTVTPLISTGLHHPYGVAVDSAGNLYIADTGDNAIKEWSSSAPLTLTTLVSGLNGPSGVAVDGAGNVYFSDTGNNAIGEWNASTQSVSTLVSSGLDRPWGVAVDGSGNVYFADEYDNRIEEWSAISPHSVAILDETSTFLPLGVAVDGLGNVYIADTGDSEIWERPRAFVSTAAVSEGAAAGSDALLPVLPTTESLTGIFAPTSDQNWLTIGSVARGAVSFSFTQNTGPARTAHITLLGMQVTVNQADLAAHSLVEGPAAGSDSDIVESTGAWTATANASWLHTSSSGSGNGLAVFTFDADTGATRTSTLTIAGTTLTVTQAGNSYVAANPLTTLVSSGLNAPIGVAVDGAGNVYFSDANNNAIKEWNAVSQTVSTLVSGLNNPAGIAVDGAGNVYFADFGSNAIQEWSSATQNVSTLVSSGLNEPIDVAVDSTGNLYIVNSGNDTIKEWNALTRSVSTLISSGLGTPRGVAVDAVGNVYVADDIDNVIKEWNAATHSLSTLVSSGLNFPHRLTVDASGNLYITDSDDSAVHEWNASTQSISSIVAAGLNAPYGVAVDSSGNVYIVDTNDNAIKERPRAFVSTTAFNEVAAAGSDAILPVLPTSESLIGIFAPTSDQSWLTIGNVSGGVANFSFTQNATNASRTAHIGLLGKQITVTQSPALATSVFYEGAAAGSDSDIVESAGAWTATANASWLHTSSSGSGNGLAVFTFDANAGATRTGTLTIAGVTLTVTQAGSSYVAANPVTTLVPTGLADPEGVAVDGAGNIYFIDAANSTVKEWNAATQTISTLVSSGLVLPMGVAVDRAGNVYISDYDLNEVKEWNVATQSLITLVSSGLNLPFGVAVDGAGNVYIADYENDAIKEWDAATQTVSTLVSSGLDSPSGVAVDGAGNVYIADSAHNAIKEWNAATQTVSTLVSSGLYAPMGVAVDASGNVYITEGFQHVVMEWNAATQSLITLVSLGLSVADGVAVDGSGNVFFADSGNEAVKEWPRAFVSTAAFSEGAAAGSDVLLPVLPTTESLAGIFAPTSDQSWLTIGSVSGDAVNFSFTQNTTSAARTAHITLLGQQVTVTQAPALAASVFYEGAAAGSDSGAVSFAGAWTASSNAAWLHTSASGSGNGLAGFTFDANTGPQRTGTMTIAGETITVIQAGLATNSLLEGPAAGSDSDIVESARNWTTSSNAAWLHISSSGSGNGLAVFTFDANTGATRTGTLTIAGATLTVTQAGSGYAAANPVTTLVSTGLTDSDGVAVDGSGNIYFADANNNAIKEWNAVSQTVGTLVSGLNNPEGVAVDGAGNVYFSNSDTNTVDEWIKSTSTVSTLVSSGLNDPTGAAVDGSGNVYIADTYDSAIKEWNIATQSVSTLVSAGLVYPVGVAVDGAGNVYIADNVNSTTKEWNAATQTITTLVSSGGNYPTGVAVDSSGNVYITDYIHNAVEEWDAATQSVNTLVSSGLNSPSGVAVDGYGDVYFTDTGNDAVKERPRAFVSIAAFNERAAAGSDAILPVLPTTESLAGVFAPTSDQNWLTIGSISGDVVNFSFTQNTTDASRTAHIGLLGQQITVTQAPSLAESAVVEGTAAGTDSLVVAFSGNWTATSNASWLHTTSAGSSSGLAVFTFDANTGATRTGTLTIAGATLTVTQAGSSYVAANPVTTLVSSGMDFLAGAAVDGAGNVYFADDGNYSIREWIAATQTVSTLVSSGLNYPIGVAVDSAGNVYIADYGHSAVKEWNASTQTVSTLVSSGLSHPLGVAVDNEGNVYIADTGNSAIKEWNATTQTLSTLVSAGLDYPTGVAVDGAGNVYISDYLNGGVIKEWNAATQTISTLVSSGLNAPDGVAVDGAGNVYIADSVNNAVKEWNAATQSLITLVAGLNSPYGAAVDGSGNVYFTDTGNDAVKERPRAFVSTAAINEGAAAGSDALLPVLSTTESLAGVFAPTSDQSWLTIGSVSGDVVNFSFTQNTTSASRTAHITLLGQQITVTQAPSLAESAVVEGAAAGTDSLVVAYSGNWTATANASWLHTASEGSESGLAVFTFDANTGATRTGTLTIAGATLTVTQAGSSYVPGDPLTTLFSLAVPAQVAVDRSGDVFVADYMNSEIKEWNAATQTLSTLVSSGVSHPLGVAVDDAGNVYFSNSDTDTVDEWIESTGTVITLVSLGLDEPAGLAVDVLGNVYIADLLNNAIKKWNAATQTVSTLVSSGLAHPDGIAVDAAGNVYIADILNNAMEEWNVSKDSLIPLVSSGLYAPEGVAVDASGNVYIADTGFGNSDVKVWNAVTQTVSVLVPNTQVTAPTGVAIDPSGNLYIANSGGHSVVELPRAFVSTTAFNESAAAGSDAILPVLPTTESLAGLFAPTSDQSWLTIGGISSGAVNFSFTQDTGAARTAHITVYGQQITVNQRGIPIWTGGSPTDGDWSRPENWGGTPLAAGDVLQFGGNNRLSDTNDFAANTLFNGITFDSGSGPFILNSSTPNGNAVNLGGDIVNNSINTQTINLPLVLTGNRTLTAATGDISISGNISETGGGQAIVVAGGGIVTFSGVNSYSGGTAVSSGTLIVASVNSLLEGSRLIVGAGAASFFGSSIAALNMAAAAAIFPPANPAGSIPATSGSTAASASANGQRIASNPGPKAVASAPRQVGQKAVDAAIARQYARDCALRAAGAVSWWSASQGQKKDLAVQALDLVLAQYGV